MSYRIEREEEQVEEWILLVFIEHLFLPIKLQDNCEAKRRHLAAAREIPHPM
jgi:hypothetical protein